LLKILTSTGVLYFMLMGQNKK